MGYVPDGARWFLADLVVAISVEGSPGVVVHLNTVLVRADTAAEAYSKARAFGRREQQSYRNAAGRRVSFRFLGLRDLNVIHEDLEDGAELAFTERHLASLEEARRLVHAKSRIGVFAPITPSSGPDYVAGEITRELRRVTRRKRRRSAPAPRRAPRA